MPGVNGGKGKESAVAAGGDFLRGPGTELWGLWKKEGRLAKGKRPVNFSVGGATKDIRCRRKVLVGQWRFR